ncbi:hypothetical protein [Enterococcus ratti]|uniref:Uncharacterized protein n=1 Tax=Enterococcus ratti TaxID=150033 RepID=A0A1L8WA93_9ENTE|nr:hypothetical protein [Enterococcus ratti]OJG77945.1 hypothetical protein RV14_GL001277 [Enterococcus ratti]
METFLMLVCLIILCWGIRRWKKSLFKRTKSKKKLILLISVFLLVGCGSLIRPTANNSTRSKEITQVKKRTKEKEAKRQAKEKVKQEKEEKRQAKEKVKQEKEAKRRAKEKAKQEKEAKRQAEINQKIVEATAVLEKAESTLTRENYYAAAALIQALPNKDSNLASRLATVDATIKVNEAAEAKRVAQKQQAAESAQSNSQVQVQNNEQIVYVAPAHGKKYHFNPNCSGLNNADSVAALTLQEAQIQGYTACKRG